MACSSLGASANAGDRKALKGPQGCGAYLTCPEVGRVPRSWTIVFSSVKPARSSNIARSRKLQYNSAFRFECLLLSRAACATLILVTGKPNEESARQPSLSHGGVQPHELGAASARASRDRLFGTPSAFFSRERRSYPVVRSKGDLSRLDAETQISNYSFNLTDVNRWRHTC